MEEDFCLITPHVPSDVPVTQGTELQLTEQDGNRIENIMTVTVIMDKMMTCDVFQIQLWPFLISCLKNLNHGESKCLKHPH